MSGLGVRIAISSGMDAMCEVTDHVRSDGSSAGDEHCAYLATLIYLYLWGLYSPSLYRNTTSEVIYLIFPQNTLAQARIDAIRFGLLDITDLGMFPDRFVFTTA